MRNKSIKSYFDGKVLYRFLESRIGCPWDDVYSELCSKADVRSKAGIKLRERLQWTIERDIIMDNGIPYFLSGRGVRRGLYIHPKTNLICRAPEITPQKRFVEIDLIPLDDGSYYEKIDGLWYHLWIESREGTYPVRLIDEPDLHYETKTYFRNVIHKLQLSKKEIKDIIVPLLSNFVGTNKEYMENLYRRNPKYSNWYLYFSRK